jgi:hypothetical protein
MRRPEGGAATNKAAIEVSFEISIFIFSTHTVSHESTCLISFQTTFETAHYFSFLSTPLYSFFPTSDATFPAAFVSTPPSPHSTAAP